jgi:hypothetical protein
MNKQSYTHRPNPKQLKRKNKQKKNGRESQALHVEVNSGAKYTLSDLQCFLFFNYPAFVDNFHKGRRGSCLL